MMSAQRTFCLERCWGPGRALLRAAKLFSEQSPDIFTRAWGVLRSPGGSWVTLALGPLEGTVLLLPQDEGGMDAKAWRRDRAGWVQAEVGTDESTAGGSSHP